MTSEILSLLTRLFQIFKSISTTTTKKFTYNNNTVHLIRIIKIILWSAIYLLTYILLVLFTKK